MESRKVIALEDVRLMWKNFGGVAKRFNNEGDRNFNVVLSANQAEMLRNEGFNVKTLVPRDDFDDPTPMQLLKVKVSYRFSSPKVMLIAGKVRRMLTEETIGELDYADIQKVDLTIKPSYWTQPGGESGVTAYLNSIYVTLVEDPLASKYPEYQEEEEPF